mgnify:CR=1 FL=1
MYNDWTITVSFYAALHIVEYAIHETENLTFSGNPINILHTDELKDALMKKNIEIENIKQQSQHILRKILVTENFPSISIEFNTLYNESRIARYLHYQMGDDKVKTSTMYLEYIYNWANKSFDAKLPKIRF